MITMKSGLFGGALLWLVLVLHSGVTHGYDVRAYKPEVYRPWKLEGWNKAPGFKTRITQSGLNFLRDVGIKMLQKQIQSIAIPDIHGRASVKVGHIYYDVTSIRINSIGIPTSSLTTNPTIGGLSLSTSGTYLTVHGNWHYKTHGFIHISDSGSFDASASSISLVLNLRVGVDSTGRPKISSLGSDCSFNVGHLNPKLHGGASWFYNIFKGYITHKLRGDINDKICPTIVNTVNTNLENELKTLKVKAPISDVAQIDYSLIESPSFNGSISTAHKGEVYPMGSATECPLPIPNIPPDSDTSRMMFLWITDFLPNSAGYVLQNVGFLQYNVTADNVPAAEKAYLNTSYFGYKFIIPEMSKKYPNMPMQINLKSTKAPVVTMKPSGIQASLVGDFTPYAILPNKSLAFLFTLNVTITTQVAVSFNGNNITWKVSTLSTKMALGQSTVGNFNIKLLEVAVNSAISLYLIPDLNRYGTKGVPLPQLEGFTFSQPVITQGDGFLKIGTNLAYTP